MKATLTFNLDDIDEKMAHFRCIKALDMALALWEIDRYTKAISESEQTPCGEDIRQRVLDIFRMYSTYPGDLSN